MKMKNRLLLAFLLFLGVSTLQASDSEKGFQSIWSTGYIIGENSSFGLNTDVSFGARINKYIYTGLGLGYDYGFAKNHFTDGSHSLSVFSHSRGYYPALYQITPFLDFKIGYGHSFQSSSGGVKMVIAIGTKLGDKFYFSFGYHMGISSYEKTETVESGGKYVNLTSIGKKVWVPNYKQVTKTHTKTNSAFLFNVGMEF